VLGERGRLREWSRSERWISSELIRVESLCTIDRARLQLQLPDRAVSARRAAVLAHLRAFDLIRLQPAVLERASEPFPTSLGTLDALHLASALLARDRYAGLTFATHDQELGLAAAAEGFPVLGVEIARDPGAGSRGSRGSLRQRPRKS
jgi:predicted nucleic acid-binding protein